MDVGPWESIATILHHTNIGRDFQKTQKGIKHGSSLWQLLQCTWSMGEGVVQTCLHSNGEKRTEPCLGSLHGELPRASSHHAALEVVLSWLIASQMPQLLIQMVQCKSMGFSRHKQLIFQQATADKIAVSDFMAKRTVALVQKILCLESFQTFPFQSSEKFCFRINFEMFGVSACQSFGALFF